MYCHYCIRSFANEAKYCSQCGRRLHSHCVVEQGIDSVARSEGAAAVEFIHTTAYYPSSAEQSQALNRSAGWQLPLALSGLCVAVAAALYLYYNYEMNMNETVLRLQSEAKTAALAGDYGQALELLSDAFEARPDYEAVAADIRIIRHVEQLKRMTEQVEVSLSTGMTRDAENGIRKLESEFGGHKEPIYDKLKIRLDELSMNLTLQKLTLELETLTTVKEHGEMLSLVGGLAGEEAEALKERILNRIRELATSEVEGLLAKRNYTGAEDVVERALGWAQEDEALLALGKRVQGERAGYEKLEQERLEQAMQRAAEEDLINQTAAVKVVRTEQALDEFGVLKIVGVLRNAATRPIYSVAVEYTVQASSGETLGKGTAQATPSYIEPGEEMTFTATIYGALTDECTVVVDNATWYLD